MVVSFDGRHTYIHTFESNAAILSRVIFYLKSVNFHFFVQYIYNKKNYNMILSCYNYGRVTIIYDATVNY